MMTDETSGTTAPTGEAVAEGPSPPPSLRLEDLPNWRYLLNEFYALYRFGPAGGSAPIRTHLKTVRERLSRAAAANPRMHFDPPERKPVVVHLTRAIDNGKRDRLSSLVRTIETVEGDLVWRHGYDRMPPALEKRFAYAEIMGPRGPVVCDDLVLGLVLFAPKTTYPAHAHKGIVESYVCLSGATSENNMGVSVPGSVIFNSPDYEHRITTSDREPVLLAYAWVGTAEALAGQKLVFSPRKRPAPKSPAVGTLK